METVQIRLASVEDAAAVATLVAGFRDHLRASTPSDADLERDLPEALADHSLEFCCAWLEGEAVGYTHSRFFRSIWSGGTDAHLEDLFVVASVRGRSVGRQLLQNAIARARKRGARALSLTTNERNEAAQGLYRREGLAPQSHALWADGREILWGMELEGARA